MTKSLFKSKIHPYFAFPLRDKYTVTEFDLSSGWKAKGSNDPNSTFNQFIRKKKKSPDEIEIFTDGSRSSTEGNGNLIVCAIYVPHIDKSFKFKGGYRIIGKKKHFLHIFF